MKKITTIIIFFGFQQFSFSQLPSQGNVPGNNTNNRAEAAWYRGGNLNTNTTPPNANIFGTRWNSPIYTVTNGALRTKLNADFGFPNPPQYPINGFTGPQVNTSGYFLLGADFGTGSSSFYNSNGAFSLLHLNGASNGALFIQDGGYRPWMKTGITFTDNQDRAYIGYRANRLDVSDLVINWSDHSVGGAGTAGPDNLIFNFTSGSGNNPGGIDGNQANGREVARMTGYGNMGIGPRFNNTQLPAAGTMGQPQSLLHLSNNSNWASWLQIGNESTGGASSNGFRIGVCGSSQDPSNPLFVLNPMNTPEAVGTAMIYNQSNRALLFSTGRTTDAFTGASASTQERFRIMALNTATQITGNTWLPFNPGNLSNTDVTRASLSHDPATPVTRPLSLFHMGYNASNTLDGWRNWMDVGTYIGYQSDNMYVGMKRASASQTDAVINWGNDVSVPPGTGAMDHLLFVFTQNNGGSTPGASNDGLEVARMASNGNFGRLGIGSFDLLGIEPQNTVHINSPDANASTSAGGRSGLRFQDLNTSSSPLVNPGNGVLSVDADGDVIYVQKNDGFGNYCGATNPTSLTGNYDVNMSNNSIYFRNGFNFMVGEVNCGNVVPARFYLRYSNSQYYPAINEGLRIETNVTAGPTVTARFMNYGQGLSILASGNMFLNGSGVATGTWTPPSDSSLKQNILPLHHSTSILNSLNPVSFYFDTLNSGLNLSSQKQYGFIAQQVETLLPELVQNFTIPAEYDSTGTLMTPERSIKTMNYNSLFALLTNGFQEQNQIIDSLTQLSTKQDSLNKSYQDQINALYALVTECCNNRSMENSSEKPGWENASNIELSDAPSIVLDQNVPNPFAEQTTISFTLPETVKKAQLLFYNAEGKLIRALDLTQRGKAQINVFANDLSSGIYTYTLVADGEVIATKKMVKQ